jgi:hypothetical protein
MASNNFFRVGFFRRGFLALLAAGVAAASAILPGSAGAETAKQIVLSEKLMDGYISSAKDVVPLLDKLGPGADKPNPSILAAIEAVLKKHGFRDFEEYENVDLSIAAVMRGIDPKTKQHSDPAARLKKELDEIQADKSISAADRKRAIDEINAELAEVQPVQHPGNIQLVLKYYDRLDALLRQLAPPEEQQKKI